MKLALINFTSNRNIEEEIRKCYPDAVLNLYCDIGEYNLHLSTLEKHEYKKYYFNVYKNNFEICIIVTEHSKRKIRKKLLQSSSILYKTVSINPNKYLKKEIVSKISQALREATSQWFYDTFLTQYHLLLQKSNIGFQNFTENIYECPFCQKEGEIILTHNYSKENTTDCHLEFKCVNCDTILISEQIFGMYDAYYAYNPYTESLLDEYTQHYPLKNMLMAKVEKELQNTEVISFLC